MKHLYPKFSLSLLGFFTIISNIIYPQWNIQYNQFGETLNCVFFVDYDNGWAVGGRDTVGALILKSTDGGTTWNDNLTIPGTVNLFESVYFTDENTGWVVGGGGVMMKTSNAGNSWDTVAIPTDGYLNQIQFINENYGWAVGLEDNWTRGIILRTIDGGINWERIEIGGGNLFISVYFVNDSLGWGAGNEIQRTTDGGYNWLTKKDTGGITIYFADELNGWTGGSAFSGPFGYITKTTDGGNTWSSYEGWDIPAIQAVNFFNKNIGWAVGNLSLGPLSKTTDGGNNWFHQESGTVNYLKSIYIIDSVTGWTAGGGSILKTANGGVTSINKDEIEEIPTDFSLSQNYPNPFNPSTSIQYAVSSRQFVTLRVYDVLGRKVATLVNEEKPAGNYEIKYNGEGLTSGIYFYQLRAGIFVETKKMVLLR